MAIIKQNDRIFATQRVHVHDKGGWGFYDDRVE